mmetsp:Transcript_3508/g.7300  ORF Transcript_3508/g.7300 Transcript_3508/m.7300 type:complete len:560 (-) Transcript_3508:787-2466(-)
MKKMTSRFRHLSTTGVFLICQVLCISSILPGAQAVIYTYNHMTFQQIQLFANSRNETSSGANITSTPAVSYPSVPMTKLGLAWDVGTPYKARLLYFPEHPHLCRQPEQLATETSSQSSKQLLPMAILVWRTHDCRLDQVAHSMTVNHPLIQFLIVVESDETTASFPTLSMIGNPPRTTSPLHIMTVSHPVGLALQDYWQAAQVPPSHDSSSLDRGPPISLLVTVQEEAAAHQEAGSWPAAPNQDDPAGYDDDFEWLLSATNTSNNSDLLNPTLTLFCSILLISSSFLLCLVAARPSRPQRNSNDAGTISRAEDQYLGRNLLTLQEIERYLVVRQAGSPGKRPNKDDCIESKSLSSGTLRGSASPRQNHYVESIKSCRECGVMTPASITAPPEQHKTLRADDLINCSICIEELNVQDQGTVRLPCHHSFHADCILPWLTERQGTCPLCKYDVYQFVQESAALDFSLSPQMKKTLCRVRKQLTRFLSFSFSSLATDNETDDEEEMDSLYRESQELDSAPPDGANHMEVELTESINSNQSSSNNNNDHHPSEQVSAPALFNT